MSNFIRYQNEIRASAKGAVRGRLSCGRDNPSLHKAGGHGVPNHHTVWIPDGVEVTTSISIEVVNGQLVASPEEDDYIYFWVDGARGPSHNGHKKLLIPPPPEVGLLAAGAKPKNQPGWCNKVTSVIFRVPKGTRKVVMGDFYYGEYSQVITFTSYHEGWEVTLEAYDRFCALNTRWPGPWTKEEGDEPSIPLPALVL